MTGLLANIRTLFKVAVVLLVVGGLWYGYDTLTLRGDERRIEIVITWDNPEVAMQAHITFPSTSWYVNEGDSPIHDVHEVDNAGGRLEVNAQAYDTGSSHARDDAVTPTRKTVLIDITVTVYTPDGVYKMVMLCTEPTRSRKVCVGVIK